MVAVGVVVAGIVMTVHLSVHSLGLVMAVEVGRADRVGHIAVTVAGVAISGSRDRVGRISSRSGMGIGGMSGSDAGIVGVVVAVPVSGVVGSVAHVVGSVVGSMGRSTVGVGGSSDHGLTGCSTHVHLLGMT